MSVTLNHESSGTNVLAQVARLAQVSSGTVSRVFNNSALIPLETRARVMNACRQLGFRPRVGLRRKQIALVTEPPYKSVIGGYVSSMMQFISYGLAMEEAGISIITEERLTNLQDSWYDGIIGIAWEEQTVDILRAMQNLPIVWFSHNYADFFNVLYTDCRKTGRMVGEYLRDKGHRRIAVIHDPDYSGLERAAGVEEMLAGLKGASVLRISGDLPLHLGVKQLLDQGCTAVWVTGVDMKVIEVSWLIQELAGKKIPEDISLIGFENPGISEFQRPSLTTVSSPLAAMAAKAVEVVLNRENFGDKRCCIEFEETLIERQSVRELK
jgi:DNA-binding LacI/PurR family transcriptional regulator